MQATQISSPRCALCMCMAGGAEPPASLMPAARLLAEPPGESTAGFAVVQEETRSFEARLL